MSSATQLSTSQAWARLRESVVGRLGVVIGDQPDIFPVSHVVDHGTIVFRTAAGTKFSAANGRAVAFEVDGYDEDGATAWSVVVKGSAHEVLQLEELLDALELHLVPWQEGSKPHYMRIVPDSITGMSFPVAEAVAARLQHRVAGDPR